MGLDVRDGCYGIDAGEVHVDLWIMEASVSRFIQIQGEAFQYTSALHGFDIETSQTNTCPYDTFQVFNERVQDVAHIAAGLQPRGPIQKLQPSRRISRIFLEPIRLPRNPRQVIQYLKTS